MKEKDSTLNMGNMNAKLENNNSGYQLVMGKHGIGSMNENALTTVFPHKSIHKPTWMSPDHTTKNQINRICRGREAGSSGAHS